MKDTPLVRELKSILKTRILGKQIFHLAEIDSTNNFALHKAKDGALEGTLVLADSQKKGRGQRDHIWYSPKGGLYLSIILRPGVTPSNINFWNIMAGLAVINTLRDYTEDKISLKLPNDVLINGRKVAGILAEMQGDFKHINYLVMGIGININFELSTLPEDLWSQVTVLQLEGGRTGEGRLILLKKLLENLEKSYLSFLSKVKL